MDKIPEDFSTPALAGAIKRNLYEFFRYFEHSSKAETYHESGLMYWHTRIQHPWFNGVVGIYNIATAFEARKQGVGAAMTLAPLREARRLGYRVGVLQSSEMGLGVYKRLGFEKYCDMDHYFWTEEG